METVKAQPERVDVLHPKTQGRADAKRVAEHALGLLRRLEDLSVPEKLGALACATTLVQVLAKLQEMRGPEDES